MVRPSGFAHNDETAGTNAFMHTPSSGAIDTVQARAAREFEAVAAALREAGVGVAIYDDPDRLPDAVFPNNWFSTHLMRAAGARAYKRFLITYPMLAPSRRRERREGVFDAVRAQFGVTFDRRLALEPFEREAAYLEGTGSLVLDRVHGVAYAVRSPRTHARALEAFARQSGYRVVAFDASTHAPAGETGRRAIYHTNVMMSMGRSVAVWCPETLDRGDERLVVEQELAASGRELVEITPAQVDCFAGNVLELAVEATPARSVFAMSTRAYESLARAQRAVFEARGRIVHVGVPTIEDVGGGGVRCMLAEVFG